MPIWRAEICKTLAETKFAFLCPAELDEQFDPLQFDGEALAFVKSAAAGGWVELARDIMLRRTSRHDLFGRGIPQLKTIEQRRRLLALTLAPWPALLETEKRFMGSGGFRGFDAATTAKIAAAL